MTNIFERRSGTREKVLLGLATFPEIDINQLSRDLDLEGRASASFGPQSLGLEEDPTEIEIIRWIERRGRTSFAEYDSKMGNYQNQIEASSIGEGDRIDFQRITDRAVLKLKALSVELDTSLQQEQQLYQQAQHRYESFRADNGLTNRDAYVPSTLELWGLWLASVMMWVLESFINGLFFSDANALGLVGGMGVAGLLSLFNLLVAMLQGRCALKLANHRRPVAKGAGFTLVVALLVAAAAVNLTIGVYRDIYIANEGDVAFPAIVAAFRKGAAALESPGSIALVLLGLIFHVCAVISFSRMWDPYPGFTRRQTDWDKARQRYEDYKAEAIDRVEEIFRGAHQEIGTYRDEINGRSLRYRDAVEGRERLHRAFVSHLEHLRETADLAIERYRGWKSARAGTAPAPAHPFPTVRLSLPDAPVAPVRPSSDGGVHAELAEQISQCLSSIKSATEYEINRIGIPKMNDVEAT